MDFSKETADFKTKMLEKIKDYAIKGNTNGILSASKVIEELEILQKSYSQLENRYNEIKNVYLANSQNVRKEFRQTKSTEKDVLSAKAQGELRRKKFLDTVKQKGIYLSQIKGVRYKSQQNNLVGIASASEVTSGHWFLGLPPDNYDTVVLLCENKNGIVNNIIPSREFITRYLKHLSRDSNGQIKFNISNRNGKFVISIPGFDSISIDSMINQFQNL